MKRKLISVSLLSLGALTATVAYTVKEKPNLENVIVTGGEAEPEITQEYIENLFENPSVYDYDGTKKGPKLRKGALLPKGYVLDLDANAPINVTEGIDLSNMILGDNGDVFLLENKVIVNKIAIPVEFNDKVVVLENDVEYHHVEKYVFVAPLERLAKIGYSIDGKLINGGTVDGIKLSGNGSLQQHKVVVRYFNRNQNFQNYEKETIVTIIPPTQFTPNDYVEGKNYYEEKVKEVKDRLTLGNVPGVSVDIVFIDKNNKETKDLTNAGDYKALITYSYTDTSGKVTATTVDETVTIINRIDLAQLTLKDKTEQYDGNPKPILIEETLPKGVKVAYSYTDENGVSINEPPTLPGIYDVGAIVFGGDNYNYIGTAPNAKLIIEKGKIEEVTFKDKTETYNGKEQSFSVERAPEGALVTYTYEKDGQQFTGKLVDAGIYKVKATVTNGSNYEPLEIGATLTIEKAALPVVTLDNGKNTYDGSPKSLKITEDLPAGVKVEYIYKKDGVVVSNPTEAGDYEVTVTVDGGTNYEYTGAVPTATLTIEKANIPGVTFTGDTVTYDKNPHTIEVVGKLPNGVTVSYASNEGTDAGVYSGVATLNGGNNYKNLVLNATLVIKKAVITGVIYPSVKEPYDGKAKTALVSGTLPSGVTTVYTDNEYTDAGTYTANVVLTGGKNYEDLPLTTSITIDKAVITGVIYPSVKEPYDGKAKTALVSGTLPNGVTAVYTDNEYTDAGTYTANVVLTGGKNYIDLPLTTSVTIDKAAITGVIYPSVKDTYDGKAKTALVSGTLPNGVTAVYTDNEYTDAGTYTANVVLTGGKNYEDLPLTTSVTIDKAVITGVIYPSVKEPYDGKAKTALVSGTLPSGVTAEYTANEYTDAGTYTANVVLKGGKNYEDLPLTTSVTIDKAVITGVTYPSVKEPYDGKAKTALVSGTLPSGVTAEYTANEYTDAGTYTANVVLKGGKNYEDLPLTTSVTIDKAVLTGVELTGKTVTYTGSPVGVTVTGDIPTDGEVTYTYAHKDGTSIVGEPTEAGEYTVTAIVKGGNNYTDKTISSTVTIGKAVLTGVELTGKTVTYTGSPVGVVVAGDIPTDGEVTYTYAHKDGTSIVGEPTEAGEYTVTAIVKGGNNYTDKTISSTVTIGKAVLTGVELIAKTVTYTGSPVGVTVTGDIPTDGEVTYTYAHKDGTSIVGEPTEAGEYTVTAIIKGGNNYTDKTISSTVTIGKAVLTGVELTGKTVTYTGSPVGVVVTGDIPTDGDVTYTYAHKDGTSIVGEPTEAGEYTVTAIVKGGNNYTDKTISSTVTIGKAVLTGVELIAKTVTYTGSPVGVVVTGDIPTDGEVTYTYAHKDGTSIVGEPTEAGEYTVTAIVKGGNNYEDKTISSTVTIGKAVLTGVDLTGKTVTYTGSPVGVVVTGDIPTDGEVTYTYAHKDGTSIVGEPTEAGEYTVTAIVKGGNNYTDKTISSTVTIKKAIITGVTYPSVSATYDGSTHKVVIVGSIPNGVTVSYEGSEGTNAGDYSAKAILNGGKNYEDTILSSTLRINKADITGISFTDKVVAYNKQEQFIEILGALPNGVTVVYEKAKQTEVGVYNAIAKILGGTNYNDLTLTANFEIKEDRLPSKDAEIFEFIINGISYKNPGEVIEYILEPTQEGDDADIRIVSVSKYSSLNVPDSFTVDTRDPRVYYTKVTVTSEDGKTSKTYTIKLIKPIEDRLIILQKFQNTLLINNNPSTNGGYTFVSYQWYKNGEVVSTKQSYSVGQSGQSKLDPNDNYYLVVRTTTGEEIYSTRIDIYEEASKEIKLYPNPVSSSDMTTNIMVNYKAEQFENGRVEILTVDGRFIYRQELSIGENRVTIPHQVSTGIYLAVIDINGKKQTIRFTIK